MICMRCSVQFQGNVKIFWIDQNGARPTRRHKHWNENLTQRFASMCKKDLSEMSSTYSSTTLVYVVHQYQWIPKQNCREKATRKMVWFNPDISSHSPICVYVFGMVHFIVLAVVVLPPSKNGEIKSIYFHRKTNWRHHIMLFKSPKRILFQCFQHF